MKWLSATFLLVLIPINVVFSGFRDFGVGIDTTVYIDWYFEQAQAIDNLKDLLSVEGSDAGFLLLAYIASFFSNDSQSLLVITALFIQTFYFLALWQCKKTVNISIFVATALFCLIYYGHTLNLMRQFCALSLLAFGFSLFIQGKWKTYAVLQVCAYFFHSSSVLGIIVPLIWYISRIDNRRNRNLYSFMIIIGTFILLTSFFYIMPLFSSISARLDVLIDRYDMTGGYANNTISTGTGLGKLFNFIYPIAFVLYAAYKKALDQKYLCFLFVVTTIASLVQVIGYYVDFLDRLAFYFSFISYIFLSKVFVSKKINTFVKIIMFAIYINSWYGMYIIGGGGDIVPYKSKILGIN